MLYKVVKKLNHTDRGLMVILREEIDEDTLCIETLNVEGYEKVLKVTDKKTKLKAFIVIHSTRLGPTLGGVRIHSYVHEEEALTDGLRLAKAMTYKSALAQCGWGGGKSVIMADPRRDKSDELLFSFAKAVDFLKGEYIAAEDVGSTPSDMNVFSKVTPYVVGLDHIKSSGNPSPFTAWGVFRSIQATLKKLYGSEDVQGRTIAIQGLGSVGSKLCEYLFWAGAKLLLADHDEQKAAKLCEKFGATLIDKEKILFQPCDILSPCAMGGIVNSDTIPEMRCCAIAGAANNQLLKDSDAEELRRLGIWYAPDFVVNAGGLINVTAELAPGGYDPTAARTKTHQLFDQLLVIYDIAQQNGCSTNKAAISLGDYRLRYGIGRRIEPIDFPFAHAFTR